MDTTFVTGAARRPTMVFDLGSQVVDDPHAARENW